MPLSEHLCKCGCEQKKCCKCGVPYLGIATDGLPYCHKCINWKFERMKHIESKRTKYAA